MTNKKNLNNELVLTRKNIRELKEELRNLVHFKQKEIIEELKQARSQGDLSENSEYDAAKQKQVEIENRINEITNVLEKAHLITSFKKNIVTIGKKVELLNVKSQEKLTIVIGTVSDINIDKNIISNFSPLARSLMNCKVGDRVTVNNSNNHFYQVEIISIK